MKSRVYLAIDLGASSGRVIAGVFDGKNIELEEIHRFPNGGHRIGESFHWDLVGLFSDIKKGLMEAGRKHGARIVSAGVDTWGVDFGLVDGDGRLLGLPHQYRDPRTNGMEAEVCRRVPRRQVYETTGIQFMFFNTIFQLMAELKRKAPALDHARRILFTPDLINYWLTGQLTNEYTIASTSQLVNARTRTWARGLIRRMGLPPRIFCPLIPPGTRIGELQAAVREETGLGRLAIIAPGCHDTASAIAAVPAEDGEFAYLSSGTWSLMGVETKKPIINDRSYQYGFTNEGGVCGTLRVLKNICGLWLIQECRRIWEQQGERVSFEDLRREALAAEPFAALIYPDDPVFSTPGDMPARIAAYCRRTRQKPPATRGAVARAIYESLALRYREVFGHLEDLTGRHHAALHVVGGGVREITLNQFTADALNRPVHAGPVEATAAGNILLQMIATRAVPSLAAGRALVRRSFPVTTFMPNFSMAWDEAYARFQKLPGARASG
ncbi:MAG: rhamnulokinase [Kiritimatiellae bacterium]|nr:rhamnulokinase [Kiritimatiellia bacterium]